MGDQADEKGDGSEPRVPTDRRVRADALRNVDILLRSANAVFATSGVDAPVREIAEAAGQSVEWVRARQREAERMVRRALIVAGRRA